MGALVAPVGNEDARDAVEVSPGNLRDEARPNRLPHELSLELRILLTAPQEYPHHPRVRPLSGFLDRQPVHPTLVNVRVEPLVLPPPRNTQPILSRRFSHAYIIPQSHAFSSANFLQTSLFGYQPTAISWRFFKLRLHGLVPWRSDTSAGWRGNVRGGLAVQPPAEG